MNHLWKEIKPSTYQQPIYLFQSKHSRALLVGYLDHQTFIPGRLLYGGLREAYTYQATVETLSIDPIKALIQAHQPHTISTITVLRETLSCSLGKALWENGVKDHFGDAFIGATHVKSETGIKTAYLYENIEGLDPNGFWIIADSICMGRNLSETLKQLLSRFAPKGILLIAPLASRRGIETIGQICDQYKIPTTFVAWGGLIGVDEKTLYDMPWGHPDTEPLDTRDQELFVNIFGPKLCVGGDFGNNYYSPTLAKQLYEEQLKEHEITPTYPSIKELMSIYTNEELVVVNNEQ